MHVEVIAFLAFAFRDAVALIEFLFQPITLGCNRPCREKTAWPRGILRIPSPNLDCEWYKQSPYDRYFELLNIRTRRLHQHTT